MLRGQRIFGKKRSRFGVAMKVAMACYPSSKGGGGILRGCCLTSFFKASTTEAIAMDTILGRCQGGPCSDIAREFGVDVLFFGAN